MTVFISLRQTKNLVVTKTKEPKHGIMDTISLDMESEAPPTQEQPLPSQPATPSLSQYFNQSNSGDIFDQIAHLSQSQVEPPPAIPSQPETLAEPNVCRIFSEAEPATFLDGNGERVEMALEAEETAAQVVQPTEMDCIYSIWVPGQRTQAALQSKADAPPGTFFPERDMMTMPGVILEEDMVDPVRELVSHYHGEAEAAKRCALTPSDVTQDDRGLRELIRTGNLRSAVNLLGRLLSMYGQGPGKSGHPSKHTPHSLQLWFSRIALLVKLHQFSIAEVESEPFGDLDRPDLYYQYYPELYGGRVGSMAPFGFRLLLAELPQYTGKFGVALERLYGLLAVVKKVKVQMEEGQAEGVKVWAAREVRVMYSIANCAIYQKDYPLAVNVLEELLEKDSGRKAALHSAIGRLYLQQGDVRSAQRCFNSAGVCRSGTPGAEVASLLEQALLDVAQNAFQDAYVHFQKAFALKPGDLMIVNNMAVCLLYLGRLSEALKLLEGEIISKPKDFLYESALVNVCTLYELESSFSNQKKLAFLALMNQHKGDGVNIGCLKIQV